MGGEEHQRKRPRYTCKRKKIKNRSPLPTHTRMTNRALQMWALRENQIPDRKQGLGLGTQARAIRRWFCLVTDPEVCTQRYAIPKHSQSRRLNCCTRHTPLCRPYRSGDAAANEDKRQPYRTMFVYTRELYITPPPAKLNMLKKTRTEKNNLHTSKPIHPPIHL